MTDTLLPKKPLCEGAWAIPPTPQMRAHGNDYHTCSICGEPTDDPRDTGLPKNDEELQNSISRLLGDYRAWINKVPGDTQAKDGIETRDALMQLIKARDTKMLEYVIGEDVVTGNEFTGNPKNHIGEAINLTKAEQRERAEQWLKGGI